MITDYPNDDINFEYVVPSLNLMSFEALTGVFVRLSARQKLHCEQKTLFSASQPTTMSPHAEEVSKMIYDR